MDRKEVNQDIVIAQDILDELDKQIRVVLDKCDPGSYLYDTLLVAQRNCAHVDLKLKVAFDITESY